MRDKPLYILGISCYYHDSAVALLCDGQVIFAASEERYTRRKNDEHFPINAIRSALAFADITMTDITAVGFYEKPLYKFFDRIMTRFFHVWPRGFGSFRFAMRGWMMTKLWTARDIKKKLGYEGQIYYIPHHLSHAAGSYFSSGFRESAVLVVDGVGEWATVSVGYAKDNQISLTKEIRYPHSLGLLYSAITYFLGFKVNSDEYKVMGLAPYGEPVYTKELGELIDIKDDGSFQLNMKYFTYENTLRMTGKHMESLFGFPRRNKSDKLESCHKDLARSLQEITNDIMLGLARYAQEQTGSKNLCLSGGVALNCVANGHILKKSMYENVFVQPASGDAGGALGVTQYLWHTYFDHPLTSRQTPTPYLGESYDDEYIRRCLSTREVPYIHLTDEEIFDRVAQILVGDNVVGWFQGRMEFGPRALGNRSILADARNVENWKKVNLKIKYREDFRPFAPAVMEEHAHEYFQTCSPSPYMLVVADVKEDKRSEIPAVTHIDGSARFQTVSLQDNERFYRLLSSFYKHTGTPILINTSFNVRDEPIVRTPEEALQGFLATQMDYLVLGNCLINKKDIQNTQDTQAFLERFKFD